MAAKGFRWTGAVVLLVIAAVLVTGALVARFARGELLDTDRYVETVAPLATDPAVQEAVTNRVTTEIVSAVDVPALAQQAAQASELTRAPAIAALVSGPISDWLESFIRKHVGDFVRSPRFANLWANVNRAAHEQIVAILTDKSTAVKIQNDEVVLDLAPVITAVKDDLVANGFGIVSKLPTISAQFPLVQSDALPRIQRSVRLLDRLATWLPWLSLLIFGLAVWLAPGHRRAALLGCVLVAIFMIAVLIAYAVARRSYEDQLSAEGLSVPAGTAVYETVLRFLVTAAQTWLVLMLIVIVWLFLAGPGRLARGLRGLVVRGENLAGTGIARTGWHPSSVPRFLRRYGRWCAIGLGVLAAIILLFSPTVAAAIWLSVLAVVLLIAAGILMRIPDSEPLPLG